MIVRPEPTATRGSDEEVVRTLGRYNQWRLNPGADPLEAEGTEARLRSAEIAYLEQERRAVHERAQGAPRGAIDFVTWFDSLKNSGPGQGDPLFEWLENHASLEQMTWFLRQEVAGEAGFDDLVALTQIKLPWRAKLELARNYWDEMGQGHASGMHGPMLSRLATQLGIDHPHPDEVVWEAVALADVMMGLAVNRRYAYHSVGALGVIELTAPGRAKRVNAGLRRLGVAGEARRYFALHATLDIKHSEAWNREVIQSLVADRPDLAVAIAEGALMRLAAGARCFERYRKVLAITLNLDRVA